MNHKRPLLLTLAILMVVAAAAGTDGIVGRRHSTAFAAAAQQLRDGWAHDEQGGVPAASFAALQSQLDAQAPSGSWFSPTWLRSDGLALIDSLQRQTDVVWAAALDGAKSHAASALTAWQDYMNAQSRWVPAKTASLGLEWPTQLSRAGTPAAYEALAQQWTSALGAARQQVQSAQQAAQAAADAALAAAKQQNGSRANLIASASGLLATARLDRLDDAGVAAALTPVQAEDGLVAWPSSADQQLSTMVVALRALIALNDHVGGLMRPTMLAVSQAQAERTSGSGGFAAQFAALGPAYSAAATAAQMQAVQQQAVGLQAAVNAELSAQRCGHSVAAGKVITINLTLQEMVFYQDGCAVQATPVSSGRPNLRTPTGNWHVFLKQTPWQMVSPWPKSSPYYYPPTWVTWVMEFAPGGYFIHDAYWEATGAYGPGSENNDAAASHGCVHTPTPVMQWAYSWTPVGTPVIVTA